MRYALATLSTVISLVSLFVCAQEQLPLQKVKTYQPKGATCVIHNDQDQIILVQDYLTRKLSLPGGGIESHEALDAAAKRETREETGIDVDVGKQLAIDDNRVVFACKPNKSVGYMNPAFHNHFGAAIIPALNAEHFGKEIRQVYLTSLTAEVLDNYRYPSDAKTLQSWIKESHPSAFHLIEDLSYSADELQIKQLSIMASFQHWVSSVPIINNILFFGNGLGEGVFAVGLLAILLLLLPLRYGLTLAFALLATAFSVNLLKMGFSIPRPFYFLPSLQQAQASGFSFPSGHTTQAAAIVGLLLGWVTKRGEQHGYIGPVTAIVGWLVLSLFAGAARVWLGVHYPTDIAAGIGLGGLIALVSLTLYRRKYAKQKRFIESKRLWLLLLIIYFIATLQLLQPLYVYSWFAALGLFFSLFFNVTPEKGVNISPWQQVITCLVGVGIIIGLSLFLITQASSSVLILAMKALAVFSGMLWILIGAPYLMRCFKN
ncbi:bifunctional NUDIX hydrolase/phosphatase PAP2 family protein [Vibrio caribbeanicus]|uniref:bifunctional NUDIX hydrolase/phosphatase PAP2 family protein n=1 Tax=Vibrio caribbeanicus TaxID=701175 RepID=UPI0022835FB3|nr:phosphatase PAP2 family protein [Vibrio caribbeanicus]MCY9842845.1 phosphatase PAP2 family protein [Vibrio caribbeanicus]